MRPELENSILLNFGRWLLYESAAADNGLGQPTTSHTVPHPGFDSAEADGRADAADTAKVDNSSSPAYLDAALCTKLAIPNDDVDEVETEVGDLAGRLFAALLAPFDRDPVTQTMSDAEKAEYHQKQEEALAEVTEALSTDHGRDVAVSNCKQLARIIIDVHKIGVPKDVHAIWAAKKRKTASLTAKLDGNLTCSQRAAAVENAVKGNKRLAIDVTKGFKLAQLVLNPKGAVYARINCCKSNFGRALTKTEQDNSKGNTG